METAIKKAIEGGYKDILHNGKFSVLLERHMVTEALLDPIFWQALGKANGWHKGIAPESEHLYWKAHWHSFIDHLAEGKDINSFFEELLNNE